MGSPCDEEYQFESDVIINAGGRFKETEESINLSHEISKVMVEYITDKIESGFKKTHPKEITLPLGEKKPVSIEYDKNFQAFAEKITGLFINDVKTYWYYDMFADRNPSKAWTDKCTYSITMSSGAKNSIKEYLNAFFEWFDKLDGKIKSQIHIPEYEREDTILYFIGCILTYFIFEGHYDGVELGGNKLVDKAILPIGLGKVSFEWYISRMWTEYLRVGFRRVRYYPGKK